MGCLVLNPDYNGPAGATAGTGGDMKICGDQVVDVDIGETCDDGNIQDGDGCNANCQWEIGALCGNGVLDIDSEECDSAILPGSEGYQGLCSPACKLLASCGDGKMDVGEQCDDGNTQNGDNCSANCQVENSNAECGNNIVEAGEKCDDGNTQNGDGCDANCQWEAGKNCGNGVIDADEECDDGNTQNGDGCDASCHYETCGFGNPRDCGKHVWSFLIGDQQSTPVTDIATDSMGNVYTTGDFSHSTDFNAHVPGDPYVVNPLGKGSVFLAKYSPDGIVIWVKAFDALTSVPSYLGIDAKDQVYLVGQFQTAKINFGGADLINAGSPQNDIFWAKFDQDGKYLSSKSFSGTQSETVYDIDVNDKGETAIACSFSSPSVNFGGTILNNGGNINMQDDCIVKLNENGNYVWGRVFPERTNGGYGPHHVELNQAGDLFWSGDFNQTQNPVEVDNGIFLKPGDIFLAKYEAMGKLAWHKTFGAEFVPVDSVESISSDAQGNIWVAGTLANGPGIDFGAGLKTGSVFYAGFSPTGAHLASQSFSNPNNMGFPSTAQSIHFDPQGNLLLGGTFLGSIDFGSGPIMTELGIEQGYSIFVTKFSKDLKPIWSKSYGSVKNFIPFYKTVELTSDPQGYPILGGTFAGSINFGGNDLVTNNPLWDGFLAKLFP